MKNIPEFWPKQSPDCSAVTLLQIWKSIKCILTKIHFLTNNWFSETIFYKQVLSTDKYLVDST